MIAGWMYYVSRKYPKRTEKRDPLQKAFTLWIMLLIGYGLIVIFGFRSQEEAKGDVKYLVIALFLLIAIYGIVSWLINKPIPSHKLYIKYVLPDVKRFWNAEPYAGQAYFNGMIFHKVIDVERSPRMKQYLIEMGKTAEKMDVFFGQAMFGNVFKYLAVRDKYTGEDVMMARPPILTESLLMKFLGEDIVSSFSPTVNEYDTQTEGTQAPQQQTEIRT